MRRPVIYLMTALMLATALAACSKTKKPQPSVASYGWFAGVREEIVTVVRDPQRAEQMLLIMNDVEKSVFDLEARTRVMSEEFKALNKDYDTSREDLVRLFEGQEESMRSSAQQLWQAQTQIKNIATEEEWEKIGAEQAALYESWRPKLF